MLRWILIVLAHWNNSPWVDICRSNGTHYSDFEPTSLLNAACLAEKQQIPILKSSVWPDLGSNPNYSALDANTPTITLPMRFQKYIHVYAYSLDDQSLTKFSLFVWIWNPRYPPQYKVLTVDPIIYMRKYFRIVLIWNHWTIWQQT